MHSLAALFVVSIANIGKVHRSNSWQNKLSVVKQTSVACQRRTPVWHVFSHKVLRKNGVVGQPGLAALQVSHVLLRRSGA